MKTTKDYERHSYGFGFIAPFCMIILSLYWIINTPISSEKLFLIEGFMKKQNYYPNILYVYGDNTKYIVVDPDDLKRLNSVLADSSAIRIWVEQYEPERQKNIKRLDLGLKTMIKYNYWKEISFSVLFGFIGVLLLPIVVTAKRKQIKQNRPRSA